MKRITIVIFAVALSITFSPTYVANATLWDRGGGLIYDDDLDITWLQDANYAMTSGYDADGLMNWLPAVTWADELEYYDSERDVTWDDWRLPITVDGPYERGYDGTTTGGWNITTSEMGYMFYESLGNLGYYALDGTYPQPGWGLNNTDPFINLQPKRYWSGTEYGANPASAWDFTFYSQVNKAETGRQTTEAKADYNNRYAWAVMDGDVAPILEPATILLLGTGLIALVGFRRKFRK